MVGLPREPEGQTPTTRGGRFVPCRHVSLDSGVEAEIGSGRKSYHLGH